MSTDRFRELTVRGGPIERGEQHGEQLRDQIRQAIEFYRSIFDLPESEIRRSARNCKRQIAQYGGECDSDFTAEIESIARAASVEPEWIYALNARSELLELDAAECTALYHAPSGTLAQNWDWSPHLLDLVTLMTIELENGLRILTMTEPGIIGKVGFNSNGLGVCLNILRRDGPLDGLPVHIVLRAVLESPSFETARRRIRAAGGGKASNLLVGDAHGNSANFEFTADGVWEPATSGDWSFHTNHYQTKPVNPNRGSYECSFTRLETSQRLAGGGDGSRRQIIELLHDQSTDWPIHRCFTPHPEIGPLGTVATLLMDLPSRRLSVQRAALDGAKHAFHDCQL